MFNIYQHSSGGITQTRACEALKKSKQCVWESLTVGFDDLMLCISCFAVSSGRLIINSEGMSIVKLNEVSQVFHACQHLAKKMHGIIR